MYDYDDYENAGAKGNKLSSALLDEYFLRLFDKEESQGSSKAADKAQRILLNILYNFTKVTTDKTDDLIKLTLKEVGEFEQVDRSCVFVFSEDGALIRKSHMWRNKATDNAFESLGDITDEISPWWMKKMRSREIIKIPAVEDLPMEAKIDKNLLKIHGIKSVLAVPIARDGLLIGYFGVCMVTEPRQWTDVSILFLQIVADVFANVFSRKRQAAEVAKSGKYYRSILENTGSVSFIIAEDMSILKTNAEWEGIFGYTKKDIEGNNWLQFFPEPDRKKLLNYHKARLAGKPAPVRYSVRILDKLGRQRECLFMVGQIEDSKNCIATIADVTSYNRLIRALQTTSAINYAQLHAKSEQALLEEFCQKMVDVGGYRFAWIGYTNIDLDQRIVPVACAGHEDGYLQIINVVCMENYGGVDLAMQIGQPFVCSNIKNQKGPFPWREEAIKRGYKALLAIPLFIDGSRGNNIVLVIYAGEEDVFDDEEVKLITETAEDLVLGIRYIRSCQEREDTAERLCSSLEQTKKLLLEIVDALAAIVEARDPYTAGHQQRVAALAVAIAEEMQLTEGEIEGIKIAGTLHDIGKIQIPSEILCKPGKLLPEEFMLIKTHSQAGYDILKNIEFPWQVAETVLQHHERLDGSGYPRGLKAEEMLLSAKIIAVADVVEAISSYRPYRRALGVNKALEEIDRLKGIQFDAQVVEACHRLFQEEGFLFLGDYRKK